MAPATKSRRSVGGGGGGVGNWADGLLLLHMPAKGIVILVSPHAFWGNLELFWFLAVVLAGRLGALGEWEKKEITPSSFALSLADPSDISCLHASSSFKCKAKPAQPQPTDEKQVLSRCGHLDPHNISLGRQHSQGTVP